MIHLRKPQKPRPVPKQVRSHSLLSFSWLLLSIALLSALLLTMGDFLTEPSITGSATVGWGNVYTEVLDTVSIDFFDNATAEVDRYLDIGSGFVNESCDFCEIDTLGNVDSICCEGPWKHFQGDYLILENTGNVGAMIFFSFTNDVTTIFPFSDPDHRSIHFRVTDNETGSCAQGLDSDWIPVNASTTTPVCSYLLSDPEKNSLRLDFKLRIPRTAPRRMQALDLLAIGEVSPYEYS